MDEKLLSAIDRIVLLGRQNPEFDAELRRRLGLPAGQTHISGKVADDVTAIREALEIRANKSISYDFIGEQRLRDQLIVDNLRMENAAIDIRKTEDERFYAFCVNAFYQLENIINYYFHRTFPNIGDLLSVVEMYTAQEPKFYFKRTGKEKTVGDILVAHKINAFCNIFYPQDKIKVALGLLRQVRNEGEHRCMAVKQEKDENNYLYKFLKKNTFNSIRIYLKKVVNTVKSDIGKPISIDFAAREGFV